jgi:hypothetical protein
LAEDGGLLPAEKPRKAVKFPADARGCFGVLMRQHFLPDGTIEEEGVTKLRPLNYTNRKVVGKATFDKAVRAEEERVKSLTGGG